jgi:hypothetical protein
LLPAPSSQRVISYPPDCDKSSAKNGAPLRLGNAGAFAQRRDGAHGGMRDKFDCAFMGLGVVAHEQ